MTTQTVTHPLRASMDAYDWLILKLVPLFGTDRVWLADADCGLSLGILVSNGRKGKGSRRHAMWLERETDSGHYSLNALDEDKRETVARHFVKECKTVLWDA